MPKPATGPVEGVTRCACGAKYWDGNKCHSCGELYRASRYCADCGDHDPEFHDPTVMDGALLCEECYLENRPV